MEERARAEFLTPCAMFLSSHYPSRVYHSNELAEGTLGLGLGGGGGLETFCSWIPNQFVQFGSVADSGYA